MSNYLGTYYDDVSARLVCFIAFELELSYESRPLIGGVSAACLLQAPQSYAIVSRVECARTSTDT